MLKDQVVLSTFSLSTFL
uniref:Uncharacterized protein n=1 Tax=Anguilla anguilla TaxID=7936 RepID=A0A0E9PXL1_ANGAN